LSILDQLLDVEGEGVQLQARNLSARDWMPAAQALAIHQTMIDAMSPEESAIRLNLSAPLNQDGGVRVADSLLALSSYERLLINDQAKEIRFRETADDVISSEIKPGSKMIIRMLRGAQTRGSWDQISRKTLADGPQAITFTKFSAISLSMSDDERMQVSETFGGNFVYGFGRRPLYLTLSGIILNGSMDVIERGERRSHDWSNNFLRLYEKHFRLTELIKNNMVIAIFLQDTIYTGYLVNLTHMVSVETQNTASVTIRMILAERKWTRNEDNSIPGTQIKGGLYLPGKNTPSAYFNRPVIEQYFQRGYASVIEADARETRRELDALLASILVLHGSPNGTASDLIIELGKFDEGSQVYYQEAIKSDVHKLCLSDALTIKGQLDNLASLISEADETKTDWLLRYSTSSDFVLPFGASAESEELYRLVLTMESAISNLKSALIQKTLNLRSKAQRAKTLYEKLKSMNALPSSTSFDVSDAIGGDIT